MIKNLNLITTKLAIPSPRKNYIKRTSMISELNYILDYKIVLIKSVAGSGKTTLFSIFIKENNLKSIKWISLDKENDELYSFWYYFSEAIKEFIPEQDKTITDISNELIKKDSILYN